MRHLLLLAALALPVAASAQAVSVYATYSPLHVSNVQTGNVFTSTGNQNQFTSYWTSGFGGGVTFGILPIGPIHLGLDLRGSTRPGTAGADTAFAGIRLGLKPPVIPFKPYIQLSGGYLATRSYNVSTVFGNQLAIGSTFTNQCAAYEVLGGIDYKLLPFLDLRLIELGGGQGYPVGGLTTNTSNITIFTVNSGIVAHF